ncbi:CLUMA_CG021126, isoform A [Clunio marinus]|uniref:CLUMA_CG021126, isoform A n=1 Tax=Clunio marinus TaxID=568069 RepID=A0A1J1J962_9DIPT|nr:CLUMA_CG021126, isoform A [Clunio marinus]
MTQSLMGRYQEYSRRKMIPFRTMVELGKIFKNFLYFILKCHQYQGLADLLMSFKFLHNFGETLGFDMESLPTLQSLHNALSHENAAEAEDELLSVITHLLVCAIEDPGIQLLQRTLQTFRKS